MSTLMCLFRHCDYPDSKGELDPPYTHGVVYVDATQVANVRDAYGGSVPDWTPKTTINLLGNRYVFVAHSVAYVEACIIAALKGLKHD